MMSQELPWSIRMRNLLSLLSSAQELGYLLTSAFSLYGSRPRGEPFSILLHGLLLTLDSLRDIDKLPKSFILILTKSPLYSRTLVPYPLISESDIFGDYLGFTEIISAL
ncbi:hypothetical protein CsSME_00044966 [Camellia sinensis var. sinensis]